MLIHTHLTPTRPHRHVSAANILDYSSDSGHNSSQGAPLSHLLHHGSISSIYRSEVNLMEDEDGEEGEAISTGERLRKSNRAASCSDLLFEMEPRRTRRTRLKVSTTSKTLRVLLRNRKQPTVVNIP